MIFGGQFENTIWGKTKDNNFLPKNYQGEKWAKAPFLQHKSLVKNWNKKELTTSGHTERKKLRHVKKDHESIVATTFLVVLLAHSKI